MSRPQTRKRRKERLVDASGCFFRGAYMGETDESVIALMQAYQRVLWTRSEHGKYSEASATLIAKWEERMRQAEQVMDGEFFRSFGQALCRLREYRDFILRNHTPHGPNDHPRVDVSASSTEVVIMDVAASVAFTLQNRLGRLPTESEVRKATKPYMAGLVGRRGTEKFTKELKTFQDRDSKDRNIPWRRIFNKIASYNNETE